MTITTKRVSWDSLSFFQKSVSRLYTCHIKRRAHQRVRGRRHCSNITSPGKDLNIRRLVFNTGRKTIVPVTSRIKIDFMLYKTQSTSPENRLTWFAIWWGTSTNAMTKISNHKWKTIMQHLSYDKNHVMLRRYIWRFRNWHCYWLNFMILLHCIRMRPKCRKINAKWSALWGVSSNDP